MALGGGTAQIPKPSAEWLTEKMWSRLVTQRTMAEIEARELITMTPEPGFACWTNWARDLGTSLPTPSRMLQFQSDFALREGSSRRGEDVFCGQDNIDRWRLVFDSDNPLAEHWPGKD